jgi:MFS family permease
VWGSLSEIFGRQHTLLAIIITFSVGSILCARSTSMVMLVASRAVQGIGGGGLITLVEVTLTDLVPLAERGAYLGIMAVIWAMGSVIGIMSNHFVC